MAIRIRRLRFSDHAALIELLDVAGLRPRVRGRDSRAAFAKQLPRNRPWYLGAFDGDRLVGCVLGTHDTRKGWINRLAIHPEYRRRRLGSRLVRACETALRAEGIEVFAALVEPGNGDSEAFFRSLGYDRLEMTYVRRKVRPDI